MIRLGIKVALDLFAVVKADYSLQERYMVLQRCDNKQAALLWRQTSGIVVATTNKLHRCGDKQAALLWQ